MKGDQLVTLTGIVVEKAVNKFMVVVYGCLWLNIPLDVFSTFTFFTPFPEQLKRCCFRGQLG